MDTNHFDPVEDVRLWIRILDQRPGVYLIENSTNGACYVGSAKKSLRQRLRNTLTELNSGRHHSYLLQADWRRYGAQSFVWWASYADSAAEASAEERWLVAVANAFEDYGGYCQRTGRNCVAASFRETERKLAKAPIPRYEYLDATNVEDRIPSVLVRTFCQANTRLIKKSQSDQAAAADQRTQEVATWKEYALCHCPLHNTKHIKHKNLLPLDPS